MMTLLHLKNKRVTFLMMPPNCLNDLFINHAKMVNSLFECGLMKRSDGDAQRSRTGGHFFVREAHQSGYLRSRGRMKTSRDVSKLEIRGKQTEIDR